MERCVMPLDAEAQVPEEVHLASATLSRQRIWPGLSRPKLSGM